MTQGDDTTTDQQLDTEADRAEQRAQLANAVEQQLLGQAQVSYLLARAAELNAEVRRLSEVNADLEAEAEALRTQVDALGNQVETLTAEKCDTGPHDDSQTSPA